jgi:LysM repeat protein
MPDPTATTAIQANNAPATAPVEAQIVTNTPAPSGAGPASSSEAGLAVTDTPAVSSTATSGSTAGQPSTFQYVVQAGDTLGSIADQFETDVDTLRSLNNLNSDSLAVGQPLYVPYKEGMTAAGMPTPTAGPYMYTIQPGDTISGLSARFNVDPAAIINANTGTMGDPNDLAVGTSIVIPGYQPPAASNETASEEGGTPESSSEGGQVVHVVQAGQGLLEIATLYGVPVADIMAANGLTDQDILRIGQKLIIPGVTKRDVAAAQGDIHIVQSGESLLSIALLYGVTVDELQQANGLDNPDAIYVGQELIIPKQQ